jgi:sec-independent protein translocase protein TatA
MTVAIPGPPCLLEAGVLGVGMPSPFELMIVAAIILLLFGKRLPDLMRSLGRSVVEFKRGVNDTEHLEGEQRDAERRQDYE